MKILSVTQGIAKILHLVGGNERALRSKSVNVVFLRFESLGFVGEKERRGGYSTILRMAGERI